MSSTMTAGTSQAALITMADLSNILGIKELLMSDEFLLVRCAIHVSRDSIILIAVQ